MLVAPYSPMARSQVNAMPAPMPPAAAGSATRPGGIGVNRIEAGERGSRGDGHKRSRYEELGYADAQQRIGDAEPHRREPPPQRRVAAQEVNEHQPRCDGRKRERQREQEERRRAHPCRAARQVVARRNAEQRCDERSAGGGKGRDPERIATRGSKGFQRLRGRQSRNHCEHRRDDRGEQR